MRPFSLIAAAIFLLMALVHLYRIAVGFPIVIGATDVGQAASWVGLAVAAVMAIGLYRESVRGKQQHHLMLVADFDPANPARIIVAPKTDLPKDSKDHQFNFKLRDKTNKNVKFAALTAADDCSTCPPDTTKPNTQIHDVKINNTPGQSSAEFTDKNDNTTPMDVSYQWEFTCDAGATVEPFDPIIANGGKS